MQLVRGAGDRELLDLDPLRLRELPAFGVVVEARGGDDRLLLGERLVEIFAELVLLPARVQIRRGISPQDHGGRVGGDQDAEHCENDTKATSRHRSTPAWSSWSATAVSRRRVGSTSHRAPARRPNRSRFRDTSRYARSVTPGKRGDDRGEGPSARKKPEERCRSSAAGVDVSVEHEVPGCHLRLLVQAGQQAVGLRALQGRWAQPARPVPNQKLIDRPATEAAIRVVEENGLAHDRPPGSMGSTGSTRGTSHASRLLAVRSLSR